MSAPSVIWEIIDAGLSIRLDGVRFIVSPKPAPDLFERVAANKDAILAYLQEHGTATPPHPFTALRSADPASVQARGVCIACGVPWGLHGKPVYSACRYVDDPDEVELLVAYGSVDA